MRDLVISILKSKVYIDGKKLTYFIKDIEKIYDEFEKKILDSPYKNNIFISPKIIGIDICILIIIGINTLLEDLVNVNNNILSNLEEGQIVLYKGRRYKYIKCESIRNRYLGKQKMIVLEAKDGILKINKNQAYNITRYFGNSNRLDSMQTQNNIENTKYLITKLLGVDIKDLDGTLKQEILVVFENKKYMDELLEKLSIEIEGYQYSFGYIFPTKYYSSVENYSYIKGNVNCLKPIFLFTSKFDIADHILEENKEYTTLLFLGEKSYIKQFSIVEYILEENIKKIIFYNNFNHIDAVERLVQNDVKINAITDINNLMIQSPYNIIVEYEQINILLLDIKNKLIKLLKNTNEDFNNKEFFMKNTFKLLKMFQMLCIPICKTEERYIFNEFINNIKKIIEENKQYNSIYNKLNYIYNNFEKLYKLLYNNNPKLDLLNKYSNRYSIIIVSNESEENFIKVYEKIKFKSIKRIEDLNELNGEDIIFTGLHNRKYIEQFGLYINNDITNILYYTEVKKYNSLINIINNNLKIIHENNRIYSKNHKKYLSPIKYTFKNIDFEEKQIATEIKEENKIYDDTNVYEDIEDLYYYNLEENIQSILEISLTYKNLEHENYQMKAYKKITFKNDKFAYLSKNYKAFCITSSRHSIIKSVDELKIKDKMIFIKDKINQDIDTMMDTIINSNVFKGKYTTNFNNVNYFKKVVKGYCERYEDGYELLSKELHFHNIDKSSFAIKQWGDSRIIGPREKEVYEAISKITRDDKLLKEWEAIYNSSELIRSFRSRLKNIFKNMLRCDIDNNLDNELVNLIINVFEDRNNYIDIVEINKIENIDVYNSKIQLNCLLK